MKMKHIRQAALGAAAVILLLAYLLRVFPPFSASVPGESSAGGVSEGSRELVPSGEPPREGPAGRLARALASAMSLEEKCAQVLMIAIGIERTLPAGFHETLDSVPAGAVLVLGYNIAETPAGIMELTDSLQSMARTTGMGVPLFIAVDHEGGTVYRFGRTATRLPDASAAGAAYAAGTVRETLEGLYLAASMQLASLGFSMNLAPVLEPLNEENRQFLEYRSFSENPDIVVTLGGIFIGAMRDGGILAVGKHFPGSGDADPHEGLPLFSFDASDPEGRQVLPFRTAIRDFGLGALMSSHVVAPSLDPELPVTLSARVQTEHLRERLGFGGIVMTDDINMKALTKGLEPGAAAVAAIASGADMIMYLDEDVQRIHAALVRAVGDGGLPLRRLEDAVTRILERKIELDLWSRASEGRRIEERLEEFTRLKAEGDAFLARFRASR